MGRGQRCKSRRYDHVCGSYAFNLHQEGIDQGEFCDVCYWRSLCEAQAQFLRSQITRFKYEWRRLVKFFPKAVE